MRFAAFIVCAEKKNREREGGREEGKKEGREEGRKEGKDFPRARVCVLVT